MIMTFKMSNYFPNPFLGYADIKGSIGGRNALQVTSKAVVIV